MYHQHNYNSDKFSSYHNYKCMISYCLTFLNIFLPHGNIAGKKIISGSTMYIQLHIVGNRIRDYIILYKFNSHIFIY